MAPGQSTEDLSQQSQAMGAGQDERGRGCSRCRLPAVAGKEAGAECQLWQLRLPASLMLGPTKHRDSRDVPSQFPKVQEGNM